MDSNLSIVNSRAQRKDAYSRWTEINSARYTATPATTSSITMRDTAGLQAGLPLRYSLVGGNGAFLYGIITAVVPNTSISIAGAALSADIASLFVGLPDQVDQINFFVASTYADANDSNLLENDMSTFVRWENAPAFIVAFSVRQTVDDSNAQPNVTVMVAGLEASTENTNEGPTVASGAWVDNGAVAINLNNYRLINNTELELQVTLGGGAAGDAENLTVEAVFVYED